MAHVAYAAPPGGFRRGEREEEDWSDNIMLDRRAEGGKPVAGAAIFAGYAARSLAVKR